jgi:bifunctional non-homologous end joining protein LigD
LSRETKVNLTNLEKVIFPGPQITKAKMMEYYVKIAAKILPFLHGRPLSLKRFPDGLGSEGFYEKNAPKGTPSWVTTFKVHLESGNRDIDHIVCNDLDTLLWLTNLAAIEIHMPLSTVDDYDRPDLVLFDLDPEPPAGIEEAVEVAFLLKERLSEVGLRGYPKTSGKKGIHVLIPIMRGPSFKGSREFVRGMGRQLAREGGFIRSELSQSKEAGTVFVDYLQNSRGRTFIAPYSLRGTPGATVSMPMRWEDLKKGISPSDFTLFNVPTLSGSDPWANLLKDRQTLEL